MKYIRQLKPSDLPYLSEVDKFCRVYTNHVGETLKVDLSFSKKEGNLVYFSGPLGEVQTYDSSEALSCIHIYCNKEEKDRSDFIRKLVPFTPDMVPNLKVGDEVYQVGVGKIPKLYKWKVNGQVKTFKRDKDRFHIPIKHGLREFGILTNLNYHGLMVLPK